MKKTTTKRQSEILQDTHMYILDFTFPTILFCFYRFLDFCANWGRVQKILEILKDSFPDLIPGLMQKNPYRYRECPPRARVCNCSKLFHQKCYPLFITTSLSESSHRNLSKPMEFLYIFNLNFLINLFSLKIIFPNEAF